MSIAPAIFLWPSFNYNFIYVYIIEYAIYNQSYFLLGYMAVFHLSMPLIFFS